MLFCLMLIVYTCGDNYDTELTMLLPAARLVTLLLRCHQYQKLAFSVLSIQKIKNQRKSLAKNNDKHCICDTFANTTPKTKNKTTQKLEIFRPLTKKAPKIKRHTLRGGKRTCYLVVVGGGGGVIVEVVVVTVAVAAAVTVPLAVVLLLLLLVLTLVLGSSSCWCVVVGWCWP